MAKDLELAYLIDAYSPVLTQKQQEVIELYYSDDLSLSEIALNSGISRQGVRDSIKRAEAVMLELEDKLGYAALLRTLNEKLEKIRSSAKNILIQNELLDYSEKIKASADEIIAVVDEIEND